MKRLKIKYFLLVSVLFLVCPGLAQTISGVSDITLDSARLKALNQLLIIDNLPAIPKHIFNENYDDKLSDLVIYVDETQKNNENPHVSIQLINDGSRKDELYGEHTLYIMVFWKTSKYCLYPKSDFFCKESMTIPAWITALEQTLHSGEFALFTAMNFVTSSFAGKNLANKGEKAVKKDNNDQKLDITLIGEIDNSYIYYAFGKFSLCENTINRVHVGGENHKNTCLATFGNYSPSWITTSVGLLATVNNRGSKRDTTHIYPRYNPYLFGHLYILKRPQLPRPRMNNGLCEWWHQISFSTVTGTRISTDLLDDFFIGICVGHIFNRLSLVIGGNYQKITSKDEKHKKREWFGSVGISYMF